MCSTRRAAVAFLLVSLASVAAAQAPEDYFPLQLGNTWTYLREWRYTDTFDPTVYVESVDRVTITTTATEEFEGKVYWVFEAVIQQPYSVHPYTLDEAREGFLSAERTTRCTRSDDGNIWRLHKFDGGQDRVLLYDFSSPGQEAYHYTGAN